MEPVIISWTPTNWITIVLMVVGGVLVIKVISLAVKKLFTGSTA